MSSLPTRAECGPAPAAWQLAYEGYQREAPRIRSAAVAPPPTLHRQLHSLQARPLLSRWLRKHPGRHVYGMAVWEGWRLS